MDGLIDVSDLPLEELMQLDGTVLDEALRRVTAPADEDSAKTVSAFNSAL